MTQLYCCEASAGRRHLLVEAPHTHTYILYQTAMYDPSSKLEEYKTKVAAEVTKSWQRSRLVNKLTEEAQVAHKTGRYEVSLDKFLHLLAVTELDPKTTDPSETRATITSNIGSALHFLGETSLAKVSLQSVALFGRNHWAERNRTLLSFRP